MIVVVIGLLISSTTISNNFITDQHLISKSFETYQNQQELKPFIQHYTSVNHNILTIKNTHIPVRTYNFSGYDLDAKATFYKNKVAPDSWRVNDSYQQKQWNIVELEQRDKKSIVATSLQINTQLFANKSKFKIARIKAGILGTKATKFHWLTIPCKTNCKLEKVILSQVLNDFKVIKAL